MSFRPRLKLKKVVGCLNIGKKPSLFILLREVNIRF